MRLLIAGFLVQVQMGEHQNLRAERREPPPLMIHLQSAHRWVTSRFWPVPVVTRHQSHCSFRRLPPHVVQQVAVRVAGQRDRRVVELLGHHRDVDAGREPQRGGASRRSCSRTRGRPAPALSSWRRLLTVSGLNLAAGGLRPPEDDERVRHAAVRTGPSRPLVRHLEHSLARQRAGLPCTDAPQSWP